MPTDNEKLPQRRRFALLADMEDDFTEPGVTSEDESSALAKVFLYDEIGGWGIWPMDLQAKLERITAPAIELHIHSPGGDAFDGIAMYNLLKDHPADIHVIVDGLAASAASVIAMAGKTIEMRTGSQMMVHDAWGLAVGPADEMGKMADELAKVSDSIASIYAARAGGTTKNWRKVMQAETWYSAKEAVEAGLATKVETKQAATKNAWDLQVFAYAGRTEAPEPEFPGGRRNPRATTDSPAVAAQRMKAAAARRRADASPATTGDGSTTTQKKGTTMPVDLDKLRAALGVTEEQVSDEGLAVVGDALTAAMSTSPPAPAASTTTPTSPAAPATPALPALNAAAREAGVIMLDPDQFDALQASARKGEEAWQTMKRNERNDVIKKAINQGKIAASREDYWRQLWDRDPDGTRQALDDMHANVIPMLSKGYLGDDDSHRSEAERAYGDLFPEG